MNRLFGPWPLGRFNTQLQSAPGSSLKAAARAAFGSWAVGIVPRPRKLPMNGRGSARFWTAPVPGRFRFVGQVQKRPRTSAFRNAGAPKLASFRSWSQCAIKESWCVLMSQVGLRCRAAGFLSIRRRSSTALPGSSSWSFQQVLILSLLAPRLYAAAADIVINEIMYNPPNELESLQYVELFNRGASTVDLSNWSFTRRIKYAFPQDTRMDPGAFLVICRSLADFSAHYGKEVSALGNFSGKLSHRGDRIELANAQKKLVDAVRYSDRDDWPIGADGYSSSLERISPASPGDAPENWAPSRLPPTKRPAGTPGKKNDSFSANLPPRVTRVEFMPKVPAPGQSVTVTASAADADGVQSLTLAYRTVAPRNAMAERTVAMTRASGDEKNGTYSAVLEGQPAGVLVRFRIKAADATGTERVQPSENEPRPAYSYYVPAVANDAHIPFGFVISAGPPERPGSSIYGGPRGRAVASAPTQGNAAFVYIPPGAAPPQVFDHVRVTPRHGGFKIRFLKDQPLNGITVANLLFEGAPRWVLAEHLAYELYRRPGVPAPMSEHIRIWRDGRLAGYQFLVEQPNKSFLARNSRDDTGNLYKLLWYGQGVVGQHEKKTNPAGGHTDLAQLINGLNRTRGAEQWEFIRENFTVEEVINYFAVNMCISNWDGFFNNYFTYHDVNGTKKWEMYPWDEDKTWDLGRLRRRFPTLRLV